MNKLIRKSVFLFSLITFFAFTNCNHKSAESATSDESKETEITFEELVSQGEFAEARMLMKKHKPKYNRFNLGVSPDIVYENADLLYGDWIMEIISSNEENKNAKIIQLLGEYPIEGSKVYGLQDYSIERENLYMVGSRHFNKLLDKILNSAILLKNYDLAEIIIDAYMEDPYVTQGESSVEYTKVIVDGKKIDGNHSYIKYNWDSKTAAQKKLNEAKRKN